MLRNYQLEANKNHLLRQAIKQTVHGLLNVNKFRFAAFFLLVAVLVSVMIVMTIDLLWDGNLNPELEFAGVITPLLDGLFLVIFITAMLDELRIEVAHRKTAEADIRRLNEELELKVAKRTKQLLEAREKLIRNEKLSILGQLAGSVGHELRNPLGVMNNAIYFLKTVLPESDETVREYLNMIKSEIDNSERIISDLLDFSRTKPAQLRVIAINEVLSSSLGKCSVPENVKIGMNIPDTLPVLRFDPLQMGQVFQNLITNGVQAMPNGGELRISARLVQSSRFKVQSPEEKNVEPETLNVEPDLDCIEISVTDTGEGIAPENMAKLFQPLFTTKAKGIGLGLVVCKNLVQANGGRIEVESELGKGTTFTVILPIINGERG